MNKNTLFKSAGPVQLRSIPLVAGAPGPASKTGGTQAGNTYHFKELFDMGDETAQIMFILQCSNIPVGSIVGFNCDQPGPIPLIHLDNTTVTSYPSFAVGMTSLVPANFTGTIDCFATIFTNPPPNASISLLATYVVNGLGS